MLTFAFMHYPYLVRILFGMPSLHLFTFLMFLSLVLLKIGEGVEDKKATIATDHSTQVHVLKQ